MFFCFSTLRPDNYTNRAKNAILLNNADNFVDNMS